MTQRGRRDGLPRQFPASLRDRPDGHFQTLKPLECANDDAAKKEAEQLVDGHDVELWQRDRKIARFERKSK
jgi:hypothetical protein